MATIRIGNIRSSIECTDKELMKVKQALKVRAPGYQYTKLYKMKKWDGRVSLLRNRSIPTGLVPQAAKSIAGFFSSLVVVDDRSIKVPSFKRTTVKLREYQKEAVSSVWDKQEFGTWWPRGVIHAATGSGKTEMAMAMIEMIDVPTLFVVHLKSLLHQTKERFDFHGLSCGVVGDGEFNPAKVTIATVQTLWSNIKRGNTAWMEPFEMVIFDEAHLVAANLDKGNIFTAVGERLPNAYARIGLTATPFMKDEYSNMLLLGATGDVLYSKTNRELIDEGWLAEAAVDMYEVPYNKYIPNSWPDAYDAGVVLNRERNSAIVRMINEYPPPILVLVQRIGHGELLETPDAPFVWGRDKVEERKEAVAKLQAGEIRALIASTIFDEGIDIPQIRTIILAGGGKSVVKGLQRLGRGLRLSEGKDKVHVVDFYDRSTRWLKNHSNQRKRLWLEQGFKVEMKKLEV